ncbi:hypothetical protein VZ94_19585 [Methylocucumis oryzae]|uniref:Peptidase C39-like domain-containing protein n=1 Tax=Methylocucumis oryzae TaxID=1632867 RepID=A0A0F3IFE2_9GAMM|nr:hypothetical protein VZ94_19585 [Methylocucumis oryzae]
MLFPDIPVDEIFYAMFSYYIKEYGDANTFINGMYRGKLNKILTETINRLQLECSIYRPFWNRPAVTLLEMHEKIMSCSVGSESVAILGYEHSRIDDSDRYSHWTVLRKVTDKSLITHDSSGESKRISLSKCRIWDNKSKHKTKPYKLSSTDLFILAMNGSEYA